MSADARGARPPNFAAVFAYEVDAARAGAFESVYGPDGDWARLFRRGEGYLGTDLWRAAGDEPPAQRLSP